MIKVNINNNKFIIITTETKLFEIKKIILKSKVHRGWNPVDGNKPFHEKKFPIDSSLE